MTPADGDETTWKAFRCDNNPGWITEISVQIGPSKWQDRNQSQGVSNKRQNHSSNGKPKQQLLPVELVPTSHYTVLACDCQSKHTFPSGTSLQCTPLDQDIPNWKGRHCHTKSIMREQIKHGHIPGRKARTGERIGGQRCIPKCADHHQKRNVHFCWDGTIQWPPQLESGQPGSLSAAATIPPVNTE
jgi:hypothetical protein